MLNCSEAEQTTLAGKPDRPQSNRCFEIIQMEWKDAQVVKLRIKSTLGGNLRLRTLNALKLTNGILKDEGENTNPFYQIAATPIPIISSKATSSTPELKKTFMYDIATMPGKIYTLTSQ